MNIPNKIKISGIEYKVIKTEEIKKVKKYKQPDVKAALAYLNIFCRK